MLTTVFALSFVAGLALAGPTAVPATAYLISTQYNCLEFNCAYLELDITRIDVQSKSSRNITDILIKGLIPKTPFGDMNYVIFSAFDLVKKIYYVFAQAEPNNGLFWGVQLNADVSAAQLLFSNKYQYPEAAGNMVGMHMLGNGSIFGVFQHGSVAFIDPVKGSFSEIGNLLPAESFTDGSVYAATAYDDYTKRVFAIISNEYGSNNSIATLHIATASTVVFPLKFKQHGERIGAEVILEAIFVNETQQVIVNFKAVSDNLGFDQVWNIDPLTGVGVAMFYDLMVDGDGLYGFECNVELKDCDQPRNIAYDPAEHRVYFQAHHYESDDDLNGTPVIVYTKLDERFPFLYEVDTLYFGFMNFQYVPVGNASTLL